MRLLKGWAWEAPLHLVLRAPWDRTGHGERCARREADAPRACLGPVAAGVGVLGARRGNRPSLDPCWSPTPTLPLARFPGCVPAQEPVPGNSLTYKPRDQAVQNLGRPESDSWRWLLEGPPCSQPGWVVRSQASGSRRCHTRNPNRILKQEVRAWLGVGVTLESVKENVACNPLGLSG